MFTVEHEDNYTKIVVVDDHARHEDIDMFLENDGRVYIRQFDEKNNAHEILIVSYHQLLDLIAALDSPEGMFETELRKELPK